MVNVYNNCPYVRELVEKKDVNGLLKEKKLLENIINRHKDLLSSTLTEHDKIKILEAIKHDEEILEKIKKYIKEIK